MDLLGSSRTTGGVFCGNAYGNNPNIADFEDETNTLIPMIGKVHLYAVTTDDSDLWDLSAMKPKTMRHEVTSSFSTVMENLAQKHSPVKCKS
jgi:hypothetical protein